MRKRIDTLTPEISKVIIEKYMQGYGETSIPNELNVTTKIVRLCIKDNDLKRPEIQAMRGKRPAKKQYTNSVNEEKESRARTRRILGV